MNQKRGVKLTETSPHITVVGIKLQDAVQVFDSLVKLFLCAQNCANGIHCWNGSWISSKSMLVGADGIVKIPKHFREAP